MIPLWIALTLGGLCRYTVRDIGFIDLSGPGYELVLAAPEGDDGWDARLLAEVRDGNVALVREEAAGSVWWLRRSSDADTALRLGDAGMEPAAALDAARRSPLRDEISSLALSTFAFVIVVEGTDPALDKACDAAIEEAKTGLRAIESQLPRPIHLPLVERRIARSARRAERVLLWSLGLDGQTPDPVVCVLYGRGKLAGEPIDRADLARGELLAQLALVGETCECDTSRDWAAEAVIAHAWPERQRRSAWDALGFDPESPMVKAEVTRILARGPGAERKDGRPDSIEALVFGYREAQLTADAPAPRTDGAPLGGERARPEIQIVDAGEGDWGFEADSADPDPDLGPAPSHLGQQPTPEPEPEDADPLVRTRQIGVVFVAVSILLAAAIVLGRKGA
ncbi:MAG: hypothetical protein GY711_33320 [bacterium]|nr:hypothetical protein [bacterium]